MGMAKKVSLAAGFVCTALLVASCGSGERPAAQSHVGPSKEPPKKEAKVPVGDEPNLEGAAVWDDPAGDCPRLPASNARWHVPLDVVKTWAAVRGDSLYVGVKFTDPVMDYWAKPDAANDWRTAVFMNFYMDTDNNPATGEFLKKEVGTGFELVLELKMGAKYKRKDSDTEWEGNLVAAPGQVEKIFSPVFYASTYTGSWEKSTNEDTTEKWGKYAEFYKAGKDWVEYRLPLARLGLKAGTPVRAFWEEGHHPKAGVGKEALSTIQTVAATGSKG